MDRYIDSYRYRRSGYRDFRYLFTHLSDPVASNRPENKFVTYHRYVQLNAFIFE